MYTAPANTDLLLSEAQKESLYVKLVEQVNKDFALANEPVDFDVAITPINIKMELHEKVYKLIQYKFGEYLNLLYIIDVPEKEIKSLNGGDLSELAEQVAFLILKREWQKVWFRNRF
ncbi:hypothetical protein [Flavobacterium sp. C4GT6]|uniref:hypothetical protein n=1 Tax=Flavobacterium sp. C4GT6 TaxID=3103818 RepID=UPI002ED3A82B